MEQIRAISPSDWLLLATAFLSFYGVGQVWLVQVSSYYLWRYVGASELAAYHTAFWRSIWFVVLAPAQRTNQRRRSGTVSSFRRTLSHHLSPNSQTGA
jgi:hypothetical protein